LSNVLWHVDHYDGPWSRCVDIGAHVGLFSVEAAKRGAQVWAFEPSAVNFQALLLNAKDFYPHIYPFQAAIVPDGNGLYCMNHPSGPGVQISAGNGTYPAIPVSFTALLRALAPIDYLKIDIEGFEHRIFRPLDYDEMILKTEPVLERVRFLQLEIHPNELSSWKYEKQIKHLVEWLQSIGFCDEPCGSRRKHAGDFCSHNHNFKE
jgi:FkbM family methyltransferase